MKPPAKSTAFQVAEWNKYGRENRVLTEVPGLCQKIRSRLNSGNPALSHQPSDFQNPKIQNQCVTSSVLVTDSGIITIRNPSHRQTVEIYKMQTGPDQ